MTYRETIAKTFKQTIQDTFGSSFHYFLGDPILIPASLLPAIIIETQKTHNGDIAPTGMERMDRTVVVKIALNKRDDFGGKPDELMTQTKLEQYAEGIDTATGEYAEQSLAGIIRRNYTMGNLLVSQTLDIDYGVFPRPGGQGSADLTAEVHITLIVQELLTITGRA